MIRYLVWVTFTNALRGEKEGPRLNTICSVGLTNHGCGWIAMFGESL